MKFSDKIFLIKEIFTSYINLFVSINFFCCRNTYLKDCSRFNIVVNNYYLMEHDPRKSGYTFLLEMFQDKCL